MKRKSLKLMLVALFGLVMGMTFVSCSKDNDDNKTSGDTDKSSQDWSQKKAKYTIMFYGCGGGNLDEWLEDAIPEIVKRLNVSNNQVRFAVMFNMSKDDSQYIKEDGKAPDLLGDWATCYRYELTPQTDLTKQGYRAKYKYKNASEVPMYKTATIVEYINWVKQNVPAENYIFMPMNHGGGLDLSEEETRAIGYDTNHLNPNNDYNAYAMGERSLVDALKQTNTHLKAIYWCGCMMGQLEVLTQLAPYCDYQFCSSHVSRSIGSLFYNIVEAINKAPDDFEKAALEDEKLNKADYSVYFVNVNDPKRPGQKHNENCDWGCWRSNKLADINAQAKKLGALLCESYADPVKMPQIDTAIAKSYLLEFDSFFLDVLDLAVNVAERLDEGQNATAKQIVTDMEAALKAANVYRNNGLNNANAQPKKGYFSLGISVYAYNENTWTKYGQNYKANDFDKATGWSKFLDMNTVSVFNSTTNPSNDSSYDLGYLDN